MKTYQVQITGVEPGLLMHRFGEAATANLQSNVQTIAPKDQTPQQQAEQGAYRLDDGQLFQPAEHIYQALVKAATGFRVKGQGKKTYKDAVRGNVLISPECIPHGTDTFEIDSRPVRIQRARIMRHRPRLPAWKLAFTVQVIDDAAIPPEVLNNILVRAGQSIGIGDYRPRFGRFIVTEFNEAKTG